MLFSFLFRFFLWLFHLRVHAAHNAVASTSVALFNQTNYLGIPSVLRIADMGCVNIPKPYRKSIKSYKIITKVSETLPAGSTASPCSQGVFFCPELDCNSDCVQFSLTSVPSG